MSEVRFINVTTRVEVPAAYVGRMDEIRVSLTHGILDEVNAFFEDDMPGVHVTYCDTEIARSPSPKHD